MYRPGGPAARSKLAVSDAKPDPPAAVVFEVDSDFEPPLEQAARMTRDAPSTTARRRDLTSSYNQAGAFLPRRAV